MPFGQAMLVTQDIISQIAKFCGPRLNALIGEGLLRVGQVLHSLQLFAVTQRIEAALSA
jgi:hypothetical protein